MKLKCEFVISNVADEIVAVPVGEGAKSHHLVLKLNEESKKIIELLGKNISIDEIISEIKKEYTIEDGKLKEYIIEFVDELRVNDLIED